jgi:hypothetical protein
MPLNLDFPQTLTLAEIDQARDLLAAPTFSDEAMRWFFNRGSALLAAAEWGIRKNLASSPELQSIHAKLDAARAKRETEERDRRETAMRRIGELEHVLLAEIGGRPVLTEHGRIPADRNAITPEWIESWFFRRGVRCIVHVDPSGRLGFDHADLVR